MRITDTGSRNLENLLLFVSSVSLKLDLSVRRKEEAMAVEREKEAKLKSDRGFNVASMIQYIVYFSLR